MNKSNRKVVGLRMAIILVSTLLILVIVLGIRGGREKTLVVPEVRREEKVLEVQPALPELRELEGAEFWPGFKEDIPEVRNEDIPFEETLKEVIAEEDRGIVKDKFWEEMDMVFDLPPSPEELRKMEEEEEKGIVIH